MNILKLIPRSLQPLATKAKYGLQGFLNRVDGIRNSPFGTDLVGYESIIRQLRKFHLERVNGDLVEVGAFLGGGTKKLAAYAASLSPSRRLFVVDLFDPTFDWTKTNAGQSMAQLYEKFMKDFGTNSQRAVFDHVTRGFPNIHCLVGDSMKVEIPTAELCFAFIDGNHDPDYVWNDFCKVWPKISSGGVVAFHDYGGNLPQTTEAIDSIYSEHSSAIASAL
jgi:hypothetical protein